MKLRAPKPSFPVARASCPCKSLSLRQQIPKEARLFAEPILPNPPKVPKSPVRRCFAKQRLQNPLCAFDPLHLCVSPTSQKSHNVTQKSHNVTSTFALSVSCCCGQVPEDQFLQRQGDLI